MLNYRKRKADSNLDEITGYLKKMTKATTSTLARHNAFLMAASDDNNYDMERYYEKAKKELDADDEEPREEPVNTAENVYPCKDNTIPFLQSHIWSINN